MMTLNELTVNALTMAPTNGFSNMVWSRRGDLHIARLAHADSSTTNLCGRFVYSQSIQISKAAALFHLTRRCAHARHRRAVERGGEADAAHAGGFELGHAK